MILVPKSGQAQRARQEECPITPDIDFPASLDTPKDSELKRVELGCDQVTDDDAVHASDTIGRSNINQVSQRSGIGRLDDISKDRVRRQDTIFLR